MAKSKDVVKQIRKATRRKFCADEKIRIVLEGLRGQTPISEICRREGIAASVYYKWSKSFVTNYLGNLGSNFQKINAHRFEDSSEDVVTSKNAKNVLENW